MNSRRVCHTPDLISLIRPTAPLVADNLQEVMDAMMAALWEGRGPQNLQEFRGGYNRLLSPELVAELDMPLRHKELP